MLFLYFTLMVICLKDYFETNKSLFVASFFLRFFFQHHFFDFQSLGCLMRM